MRTSPPCRDAGVSLFRAASHEPPAAGPAVWVARWAVSSRARPVPSGCASRCSSPAARARTSRGRRTSRRAGSRAPAPDRSERSVHASRPFEEEEAHGRPARASRRPVGAATVGRRARDCSCARGRGSNRTAWPALWVSALVRELWVSALVRETFAGACLSCGAISFALSCVGTTTVARLLRPSSDERMGTARVRAWLRLTRAIRLPLACSTRESAGTARRQHAAPHREPRHRTRPREERRVSVLRQPDAIHADARELPGRHEDVRPSRDGHRRAEIAADSDGETRRHGSPAIGIIRDAPRHPGRRPDGPRDPDPAVTEAVKTHVP